MYTYGPMSTKRLGNSLGVSPVPPRTCNFSCIYCQSGETKKQIECDSFLARMAILDEIGERVNNENIDTITFSGSGEPSLCEDLVWLMLKCREKFHLPIAVITNAAMLGIKVVRDTLLQADIVIPSLDAGSEEVFQKINRPHFPIKHSEFVKNLIDFRWDFDGDFWLEIMLVAGVNDTKDELQNIRNIINRLSPNRIYISTPFRPPAIETVSTPEESRIELAKHILGRVELLTEPESVNVNVKGIDDLEQAILELNAIHPLSMKQISDLENKIEIDEAVNKLMNSGKLIQVEHNSNTFFKTNIDND